MAFHGNPSRVSTQSPHGGTAPRPPRSASDGRASVSGTRRIKPPKKVQFSLVFEREPPSVPAMRRVLGDTLRGIGVNEDSVTDILLATTEACTNVVLHAGQSASEYTVDATVDQGACRVEVTDLGQGYPESGGRPAQSDADRELAESGRGLAIMRACVDAVTLCSAPGRGTHVVLDKRIHWEQAALPRGHDLRARRHVRRQRLPPPAGAWQGDPAVSLGSGYPR